uniref:Uncharacterized protein n=1 Tax=Amphimedon queenslandica TaxID=400682 RepID=A0A1X7TF47_AMPQE
MRFILVSSIKYPVWRRKPAAVAKKGCSKRGKYNSEKISQESKAEIGKYASENEVTRAVKHFKDKNLKPSTVRDWRTLYLLQLKLSKKAEPGQAVVVKELPAKPCGRPPLLGDKLDSLLKDRIISMRARGAPVGTNVIIGIGRGILLKYDKRSLEEFVGPVELGKKWAISIFRRMGYSKCRDNSKSKRCGGDG